MPDRIAALVTGSAWIYALLVPVVTLIVLLGWLSLMLGRQKIASFSVRGLGLSVQIRALTYPAIDERQPDQHTSRKEGN